jgi:hypothetical protein
LAKVEVFVAVEVFEAAPAPVAAVAPVAAAAAAALGWVGVLPVEVVAVLAWLDWPWLGAGPEPAVWMLVDASTSAIREAACALYCTVVLAVPGA